MAYSTIDKSTAHFNTKLYTGNATGSSGTTQSITGVGFQPDWCWFKNRTETANAHLLYDSVRGATKRIKSNDNSAESTDTNGLTSFDSDGFTIGDKGSINNNNANFVSWNWSAGGASPSQTYTVKVVSDSGNKYRFDDFGTSAVTLDLQEGGTYTFDQSDSSNSGHPLRFSTTSNGSHGGGSEYTTGVTTNGTPGSSGAYTRITVASGAATLYYYCTAHSGMGGQVNTNSTFGSSNFSGDIQSTVSANQTAGFSIVRYTGNGSNDQRIGHGLGAKPATWFIKRLESADDWIVYHKGLASNWYDDTYFYLNSSSAVMGQINAGTGNPTTSVFYIGDTGRTGANNSDYVAYVFSEKTGYSKFGNYTGNGNSDGTFVYTGFKPTFIMTKEKPNSSSWDMHDIKRDTYNPASKHLLAEDTGAEGSTVMLDILSNGFKFRSSNGDRNQSGQLYVYWAFGQTMVGSNDVPATAR